MTTKLDYVTHMSVLLIILGILLTEFLRGEILSPLVVFFKVVLS